MVITGAPSGVVRIVQAAVHHRQRREQSEELIVGDGADRPGVMGDRVAEHPEDAFDYVGEAGLLVSLAVSGKAVDREYRCAGLAKGKGGVNDLSAVAVEAGHLAKPVGNALGGFQGRVEGVLAQ